MSDVKIMIVDDNENLCKTMAKVLERKGFGVLTAYSGKKALEIAEKESGIELVFMDIKMPVMDGVETYKKLKSILPDTVVVMMTAYAVEDLIQEAIEEGAYGVLYKPLDLENVLGIAKKALEKGTGGFIMVVDDDPGTGRSLHKIFTQKGFKVEVAEDGERAIELASETEFDVIFLDVRLPTINGLETYLKIREIREDVIVILITGYVTEVQDLVDEAILSSAYTCLEKPLEMDRVLSFVDEVMSRKQRGDAKEK